MALNKLTRIGNSGFGTDTSINTTGIVTAASFSGDGSELTGITAVGSGVVVREEGSNVGTAQTINFIGTGVTATISGGVASIEITTSGGGGGGLSDIVSDTTPQLGGNLDLNSNNITGTGNIDVTGDATFSGDLDVDGHVNLDNVSVAGVSTFTGTTEVKNASFEVTNSSASGQYLQITQNGDASLNLDKVGDGAFYIRGNNIYLKNDGSNETYAGFEANSRSFLNYDGSTKIQTTSTGAIVTGTLVATATTTTSVTTADESSDTSCFLLYSTEATGDIAPKTGSNLTFNSSSGTLTASTFVGDGSGLTGIVASGSGVIVRDDGSLVGTAGTIDFGTNVAVSPISAGVVTVTAAAGTIAGINTSGTTELNNLNIAGVATANSFSGNSGSFSSLNGGVNIGFHVDGGAPVMSLHVENDGEVSVNTTLKVGTAITMSSGIITATTFSGSGASLTNLPAANMTGTLPAISGANLTNLDASDLDSGTIPDARFPATLPAISGANLTNLPSSGSGISTAFTNVQATWSVGGDTGGYTFTGPGQDGAEQNPDIYLVRGQKYRFINSTGSGHPFAIRVSNGGSAYTDGVSGSQSGTQDFNVQHDAPVRLYYQCTIHGGMIGNIYIVGASDWRMTDVTTAQTPEIYTNRDVSIGTANPGNANLAVVSATQAAFSIGQNTDGSGANHLGIYYGTGLGSPAGADVFTSNGNMSFWVDGAGGSGSSIEFGKGFGAAAGGANWMTINSSGLVGIGITNPERLLSIKGSNAMIQLEGSGGNGKQWSIISSDDVTGAAAASGPGNFVIYDDSSGGLGDVLTLTGVGGSMGLGTQDPGAKLHVSGGNIKVDSGYGIDFSATSNSSGSMTSELLDDYEEGTWEPTFASSNGAFSSVTYHGDTGGRYIKVGAVVHVQGCCRCTSIDTSNRSASDTLCIGGLPFLNASRSNGDNADSVGSGRCVVWGGGANHPHAIQSRQNATICNLLNYEIDSVCNTNRVDSASNGMMFQFSLTYTTT